MSNPTFKELERERIEKIKNLSPQEVENYIDNLNLKIFESWRGGNSDNVILYSEKLKEVIKLTEEKYRNIRGYTVGSRLDITETKLLEKNLKDLILEVGGNVKFINFIIMTLVKSVTLLEYVMMVYYHNYLKVPRYLLEGLVIDLQYRFDFKNDEFEEHLYSYFDEYNTILMKELDYVISVLRKDMLDIIDNMDMLVQDDIENSSKTLEDMINNFKEEKDDIIKNSKDNKRKQMLKDGNYLDWNMKLIEIYKAFDKSCKHYLEVKEKVLNLVNSEDGFQSIKEDHYKMTHEDSEGDIFISKEEYLSMLPSYNMKEGKFIKPN